MMQYTCKMQCSPYDLEIIKCLANLNETEEKPINDKNEESTKEKPEALKLFGDRNDMTAILEYERKYNTFLRNVFYIFCFSFRKQTQRKK